MKKIIIWIFIVFLVIIVSFWMWYHKNLQNLRSIKSFNSEFEIFLEREITGVDLTTVMNRAIENNHQYEVPKNEDGTYQNDGKNSIEIMIKPTEERKILSNGSFRKSGNERFYKEFRRSGF